MKKEKLLAADLALYIGQEIQTPYGIRKMVCVFSDTPGVCVCKDDRNCLWDTKFSLLLRPLSDLTEDERKTADRMGFDAPPVDSFRHYEALRTRYLLSIGIDLFGWIEAGLAIDKTKIQTPVQP